MPKIFYKIIKNEKYTIKNKKIRKTTNKGIKVESRK